MCFPAFRICCTRFFYKQHQNQIGKTKTKKTKQKNQAKAKQHPEAELLILENYLLSFDFQKIIGRTLKKFAKSKCV